MIRFRKQLFVLAAWLFLSMLTACSGEQASPANGILVSTQWLQDHIPDPDIVILHSGTKELYDSVHIPGARLIIPNTFTVNTSENRNEMPPADSIAELLRRVGVNNNSKIVLYHEDIDLLNRTARVFVALDHIGLGEQTVVLNGGLAAWVEDGLEVTDVTDNFNPGNLDLVDTKKLFISAAELDQQRWSDQVVVIDARSDDEYFGTPAILDKPAEGGHIEGAYSLSYLDITTDDSPYLFRSDSELKELFQNAGVVKEKETLIYCNSGIKGSLNYLVARHLGFPALMYDGSYEEWEKLNKPVTSPVIFPEENH